jgi:hypothetical protein
MVRPFEMCVCVNGLSLFVAELPPSTIDLSTAGGLKDVTLEWNRNPEWAAMTLRTITHNQRHLQQISLKAPSESYPQFSDSDDTLMNALDKAVYEGWLELDEVLVQLWESNSIRSDVAYDAPSSVDGRDTRCQVESLLSGAMARGIVRLTERCDKW